jgi:hypothetical protein
MFKKVFKTRQVILPSYAETLITNLVTKRDNVQCLTYPQMLD